MRNLRDPIHRNIPLEDWAVELVDSREMQRLRRLRQLGTASLVYPGANHTRFEHSLGAYKLAIDAARALGLTPEDARPVEAAALLHDVGHGPLSHLFEDVDPSARFRHEDASRDLVLWSGLADRLNRAAIEPRRVADLLQGQGPHGSIVSGDIDVDRMDYLVRDAHYTGLRVSVDPERLLAVMELQGRDFVVREEGLTAVESLLLARFLMYPAVYFHHACRAAERMIVMGAQALLGAGTPFDALRVMDDAELFSALRAGPPAARDVAERIDERRLFKRAFEGNDRLAQGDPFLQRLVGDPREARRVERELEDACGLERGYVLVDAPRAPLLREVGARVRTRSGEARPIAEVSTLVRTLLSAQMDHWRFWVFAPQEARERVAGAFARMVESKSVKGAARIGRSP